MEFSISPFSLFKRLWRWLFSVKLPKPNYQIACNNDSFLGDLDLSQLQTIAEYDGVKAKVNPFAKTHPAVPDITLSVFQGEKSPDGSIHKLTSHQQGSSHLFRMFNRPTAEARSMFMRSKLFAERLYQYAVPTYHLSYREYQPGSACFYAESQYIPQLKNASDYLQSIVDPQQRAKALLDISQQLTAFTKKMHSKRLIWLDLKPENLMINPQTQKLCIADTKGFFPANTRKLPAYALTREYTEPSFLFKGGVKFGQLELQTNKFLPRQAYKKQFRFSLLATLKRLLESCPAVTPETQAVSHYIEGSQQKNKLLDARKYLKVSASVATAQVPSSVAKTKRRSLFSRIFHRGSSQIIVVQLEEKAGQQSAPPAMQSAAKGPPSTTFMP